MVITEIMCERSTYYSLSIPFKNIVLANAYPWTSLQFHVYPSKPKDGILRCISFDLWCKNCISFDQSCKECISCERDAQHLDGRAGRKARGKCRVHPRSSSIEIQLSGSWWSTSASTSTSAGACKNRYKYKHLVQVHPRSRSIETQLGGEAMLQCCGVVAREVGARWWWRSRDDPSTPLPDFFQRVFLAPTDVQESLSGVDADPIGAKSI